MSERPGPVADMIWRESLRAAPAVPDANELLDWASALGEHGAVLHDCATLLRGVSEPASSPRSGWTVDIARADLVELARDCPLSLDPPVAPGYSGRPDNPAGIGPGVPAREPAADPAELAARLVRLLAADRPDATALTEALDEALELARRLPAFDYRRFAEASPDRLAAAIGTQALADFALDVRDLAAGPFGSAGLLWRAARLDGRGLGPWFRNVSRIVRGGDDLFDLARLAAADGDESAWGAWVALLARRLPGWMFRHVADDLADYRKAAPLDAMLARMLARRPATIDLATVMYLRDAALDIGAYPLAARAQQAVCAARPHDVLELEILATIQAQAGELAEARGLLLKALGLAPGHGGVLARLEALGTEGFAGFAIAHGFASPADRRETRLVLGGALPDYPRRKGRRIAAVDV